MTGDAVPKRALFNAHWLMAARPATLPAAIAPVLVGAAAAVEHEASFRFGVFAATLAAAILIQIGTNFSNDLFDFEQGADTHERLGPPRVTQTGLIAPEHVRLGTALAFGIAALIGGYLIYVGGWPILLIGSLSIVAGLAYTGGPSPLGYHGLGDIAVFVFFGVLAVTGTYYLQTESVDAIAILAAVPVGLFVTAILVVNNLRDIETDAAAGKRTLAVRIGAAATRWQYCALILAPYPLAATLLPAGATPWVFVSWLSIPLAVPLAQSVLQGTSGRDLNDVLKQTARLHFVFGTLLAIGLLP